MMTIPSIDFALTMSDLSPALTETGTASATPVFDDAPTSTPVFADSSNATLKSESANIRSFAVLVADNEVLGEALQSIVDDLDIDVLTKHILATPATGEPAEPKVAASTIAETPNPEVAVIVETPNPEVAVPVSNADSAEPQETESQTVGSRVPRDRIVESQEAVAKPQLPVDAFVSNASAKDGFFRIDAIETIASTSFATTSQDNGQTLPSGHAGRVTLPDLADMKPTTVSTPDEVESIAQVTPVADEVVPTIAVTPVVDEVEPTVTIAQVDEKIAESVVAKPVAVEPSEPDVVVSPVVKTSNPEVAVPVSSVDSVKPQETESQTVGSRVPRDRIVESQEAVAKPPLPVDAFVSNASAKDGFFRIDVIETIASTSFATTSQDNGQTLPSGHAGRVTLPDLADMKPTTVSTPGEVEPTVAVAQVGEEVVQVKADQPLITHAATGNVVAGNEGLPPAEDVDVGDDGVSEVPLVEEPVPQVVDAVVVGRPSPESTITIQPEAEIAVVPDESVRVADAPISTVPVSDQFLAAANEVASAVYVSPELKRGEAGEIRVVLQPDVLGGSEVVIAVEGKKLEVTFVPTVTQVADVIVSNQAALHTQLSARISTYDISVAVASTVATNVAAATTAQNATVRNRRSNGRA